MMNIDWKKVGLFAGGVLFGTAGVKVLASKDAKKAYVSCTAAALRGPRRAADMRAVDEGLLLKCMVVICMSPTPSGNSIHSFSCRYVIL